MSELNKIIANLSPEKRAQLIAQLSRSGNKARKEVDFTTNFAFQFNSDAPFDFSPFQTSVDDPGQDYVQIEAKASSLNFRDVMIALKQYPSSPGVPANMGSDYAGVVTKTGDNVTEFKPGDEVISLHVGHSDRDGSIRDNCHFIKTFNVHKNCVSFKPCNVSFEEACCIPTVYLTSYIGLVHLGNLKASDNVLIHTASGGVGLSALQIARWKDATVFATAGTEEKRNYLRDTGITNIYDSRSALFAPAIASSGQKIDVVLNTLSGKLMTESLKLVRPFGRFIHIDKKDIAQNTPLNMGLLVNGIAFQFLDISLLFLNPRLMNQSLKEIVSLFENESFRPIHYSAFPVKDLKKAINVISRATHIGKIVVTYS